MIHELGAYMYWVWSVQCGVTQHSKHILTNVCVFIIHDNSQSQNIFWSLQSLELIFKFCTLIESMGYSVPTWKCIDKVCNLYPAQPRTQAVFFTKGEKNRLVSLVCAYARNYRNSDNSGYFPEILVLVNVIRSSTKHTCRRCRVSSSTAL